MTPAGEDNLQSAFKSLARVAAVLVTLTGGLVLAGWQFNIPPLKSVFPGFVTMKANAALAFVLAGVALWLLPEDGGKRWKPFVVRVCAAAVFLVGAMTLREYLAGVDLGIDELLYRDDSRAVATFAPGRMAPATALNFILLAIAFLFAVEPRAHAWAFQLPSLLGFMISFVAVNGYLYGVSPLYRIYPYTSIALHTAAAFVVLSIGILLARPERGWMAAVAGAGPGGYMARRLLPAVVGLPLLLAWLHGEGERLGLYTDELGEALMAVSVLVVFALVVLGNAISLNRLEVGRGRRESVSPGSEETLQSLFEFAPDAILVSDQSGLIVRANSQAEALLGYTRDELVGMPVEALIPEGARETHARHRAAYYDEPRTRAMGKGLTYDLTARRKDGTVIPVDIALSPLRLAERLLVTTVVRDATERRRLESSVRDSQRKLSTLMNNLPGMAYRCKNDRDWTLEFASDGCLALTGYRPADFIEERKLNYAQLIHSDDRDKVWADVQAALEKREPFQLTYRIRAANGEEKWVWEQGVGIRSARGELEALEGFILDVSERRRALDALRESEQRYQLLASASPVGIFHTDAQGNCLYVNERWCAITGLASEKAAGKGWAAALHPDDKERVLHEWLSAAGEKRPFKAEYRFRRPDGVATWVFGQATGVPDIHGEIQGYVGTITDITEAKAAEQALQARYAELQALQDISQSVLNSPDLKAIAEGTLEKIMTVGAFDVGVIRLLASGANVLEVLASRGYREPQNIRTIRRLAEGAAEGRIQARVLASKGAYVVDDLTASPGLRTFKAEGVRSAVVVPIRAGEQVLGTIQLGSRKSRKFRPPEIALLESVGTQVGIAAQKAQLYEATTKHLERLQALREIDQAITSTLDLRTILKALLEKIEVFLPIAAAGTVRLLNRETGRFEFVACRGVDEKAWSESRLGARSRKIIETQAPLAVLDIDADPLTYDRGVFHRYGLVSYLGVPLIVGDNVLGVLAIYSQQKHEFSRDEIELLTTLAGPAAVAIQNARLYEETRASKQDLELANRRLERLLSDLSGLYTVLAPLGQAESAREMLDGIIERLMQATGAEAALIRFQDQSTGALTLASQRGFPQSYLDAVEAARGGAGARWVFESGEPLIAPDIASEHRLKGKVQLQVGLRSCAILPLKVRNQVRGIVHLASREPGYFHEGRGDFLAAITRQIGIAVENQELFESLKLSKAELERALDVKNQFLSVMSHELRTPLSVVGGYAAMIKDGMMGEINPRQEAALQKVLNQTADQLNMVNDIMQTTQLESESVVVERYPLNLPEFLDHLKADYDFTFDKPGVTLVWEYPAEPVTLVADGGKLRQILRNLINNAIKFTDRGTVTITARVEIGHQELGIGAASESETPNSQFPTPKSRRWVEVAVKDTGVGIPADKFGAIFEKFYQVDSSETRLYGGVGLGLYIVKRFTELLGGEVEVKSEPGKGSEITVRIPLADR